MNRPNYVVPAGPMKRIIPEDVNINLEGKRVTSKGRKRQIKEKYTINKY